MHLQLWSYNYDPEPLGIAPVSRAWAQAMRRRGHEVEVVAAHPHYPEQRWGSRRLPYRELRDGIPVLRLPLVAGRSSAKRRVVQELSFTASQTVVIPALRTPDVIVAVSPSFPALIPAMANARLRNRPWVLWLKDMLPDGAVSTGLISHDSGLYRAAARLETVAYRSAAHVVVLSESFKENLLGKGVPEGKVTRIYDPATRSLAAARRSEPNSGGVRVLCMGNIGRSQGLPGIVDAFQADPELERLGAQLILTGTGVAVDEVRARIRGDRVKMLGLLSDDELEGELSRAAVGAVTQSYQGREFNVPSKMMNYFASGLPVAASVDPHGEVARLLALSEAGWTTDSARPEEFAARLGEVLEDRTALRERGEAALRFAAENLTPARMAEQFEAVVERVISARGAR